MNTLPPYAITIAALIVVLTGLIILLRVSLAERRLRLGQLQTPAGGGKPSTKILPETAWTELQRLARAELEAVVQSQASALAAELKMVSQRLSGQVQQVTSTVIEQEIEQYQKALTEARLASIQTLTKLQRSLDQRKSELEDRLSEEMKAEKAELVAKLDQKLSDIISTYVVEALGKDVDLGAQADYIFRSLDQVKTALKQELSNDV